MPKQSFFIVESSEFYRAYMDYVEQQKDFEESILKFFATHNIKASKYYARKKELFIIPTEEDLINFEDQLAKEVFKNDLKKFKRTSKIGQAWHIYTQSLSNVPIQPRFAYYLRGERDNMSYLYEDVIAKGDILYMNVKCNRDVSFPKYLKPITETEYLKVKNT